jgi:tetratricopeptide (TPR) repeat protein
LRELGTDSLKAFARFALDRDVELEIERQREALAADPRSAAAHYNLGLLLYSQGHVTEAIAEYEAAIECDPLSARSNRSLGEAYVGLGNFEQAKKFATRAAELGDRSLLEMFERYPNAADVV